jgi:hypothetical protein
VRVIVEQLVEWGLAGETEVLGENLPQGHFVLYKSNLIRPGSNPGRQDGKPATNRLSYGAALDINITFTPNFARADFFSLKSSGYKLENKNRWEYAIICDMYVAIRDVKNTYQVTQKHDKLMKLIWSYLRICK